jgi:sugar/nucleoside kinase (ribokinase family)
MDYFDCTVIGDVFLDIAVKVDSDPRSFILGGTSYCNFIKPTFGGSGNVAVGVSTLGGKAAFIGKAGSDLFGKLYAQDLENHGVFSRVFFDKRSPTGLILVFVEENERSFLIFRGANDRLSTSEIGKAAELIRKSSFVYFCGYSLVHNPQENAVLKAIGLAKKYGVKVVFDPGAYNLVKSKRRLFLKLLDLCDIFSPNLDEALAITNATSIKGIIRELRERVPLTALKCGRNGSVLISRKKIARIRSCDVKCMDTTGAGDAFTAALIYGLTNRLPLQSIGRLANWYAAEVATNIGPRSFPSKSKIEHFLERLRWFDH